MIPDRLTLEEQIAQAKISERREYLSLVKRAFNDERSGELYDQFLNPPIFLRRDAVRLLAKIKIDHEYRTPTTARYVRRQENVASFAYLAFLDLVEVKVESYLGVFKKRIIVPK